jgi:sec-independent protein translocase protein TatB
MFDISFSEMMLIAAVALIVIGPERLPKVARTLGHLFGRMQRYVNDVKADISREMELDELRKLQTQIQDAAQSFEKSVKSEVSATESQFHKLAQEVNPLPADPAASLPVPEVAPSLPSVPEPAVSPAPLFTQETVASTAAAEPAPGQLTSAEAKAQLSLDLNVSHVPADKPA